MINLILKDAACLRGEVIGQMPMQPVYGVEKRPLNAVVTSCNTATAWTLEEIHQGDQRIEGSRAVIDVVEAGARGVMEEIDSAVCSKIPPPGCSMPRRLWQLSATLLGLLIAETLCSRIACGQDDSRVAESVTESIIPFLTSYCLDSHNAELAEAKLNLSGFKTASDSAVGHRTWNVTRRDSRHSCGLF